MSSWSEIRARSGDPLNDTINDLIARANMNEAIKDELTVADQISPIRVMRSKVTIRDTGMMTGYVRPFDRSTRYFMPLEPDGDKLRLQVKFDSGCDTLPDYSLNGNDVRISFGPTALPKLLKGTEDDGITAGDMVSVLDGKYHAYRIPVNSRNSIKQMATDGLGGFGFIFRLFFLVVDNMFRSGNTRRATLLEYIENDQVTHSIRLEIDDSGILYFYIRHASTNYSVKTTTSVLTAPTKPDYEGSDYSTQDYDTTVPDAEISLPIDYTDLGFIFNFTTHQILIYKDGSPVSTTSTGVTVIPTGDPMFPPSFADPPPPPPTPEPYVEPWNKVYDQPPAAGGTAGIVRVNRVTTTPQQSFYNVENGIAETKPLVLLYTVPVGVPYVPPAPPVPPPPPPPPNTPMDPIGNILPGDGDEDLVDISGDSNDPQRIAFYIPSLEQVGIGSRIQDKAISKLVFWLATDNSSLAGHYYYKVWDENGIEVQTLAVGDASLITNDEDIYMTTVENPRSQTKIHNGYRVGIEYIEGDSNDTLRVLVDATAPDDSIMMSTFEDDEWTEDEDYDLYCDVYGGTPNTTTTGGILTIEGIAGYVLFKDGTTMLVSQFNNIPDAQRFPLAGNIASIPYGTVIWEDTSIGPPPNVGTPTPPPAYTGHTRVQGEGGGTGGTPTGNLAVEGIGGYVQFKDGTTMLVSQWNNLTDTIRFSRTPDLASIPYGTVIWEDSSITNTTGSTPTPPPNYTGITRLRTSSLTRQSNIMEGTEELLFSNTQKLKGKLKGRKIKQLFMTPVFDDDTEKKVHTAIIKGSDIEPSSKISRQERRKTERDGEREKRKALNCNQEFQSVIVKAKGNKLIQAMQLKTSPTLESPIYLGGVDLATEDEVSNVQQQSPIDDLSFSVLQQSPNQNEIVSLQIIDTTKGLGAKLNTQVPTAIQMWLKGSAKNKGMATCKMWNGSGEEIANFGNLDLSKLPRDVEEENDGKLTEVVFQNLNNTVPINSGCRIGIEYVEGEGKDKLKIQRVTSSKNDQSIVQSAYRHKKIWTVNSSFHPRIQIWGNKTVRSPVSWTPVSDHSASGIDPIKRRLLKSGHSPLTIQKSPEERIPSPIDGPFVDLGGIDSTDNSYVTLGKASGNSRFVGLKIIDVTQGLGKAMDGKRINMAYFYPTGVSSPSGEMVLKVYGPNNALLFTHPVPADVSDLPNGEEKESWFFTINADNPPPMASGYTIGVEYITGSSSDQLKFRTKNSNVDATVSVNAQNLSSVFAVNSATDLMCHFWTCGGGGGGGGGGGTPGKQGATDSNGVISCYGSGAWSQTYEPDYHAASDSMRWDFKGLGSSGYVSQELTAYLRTDDPPEDEVTGIMGGGAHGDEPHCYNIGVDTITGETRYRMEEEHPDNIDGEDGGTGIGLQDKWIGFRYIKWNKPEGVRLEIWQDDGNNTDTPSNNWRLISSWTESEYNWQQPPDDHQITLRIDDMTEEDRVDIKWLSIREILPSDPQPQGGGEPGPDPNTQYPQNPISNKPGGSSTVGERFDQGPMIGNAISLVEWQVYRDSAVTTGTVQLLHVNAGFAVKAILLNLPVASLPTVIPPATTFNFTWQDAQYFYPIEPGDSIVLHTENVTQGSIYLMDNVGNWDGTKNYDNARSYKVFNVTDTGTFYQRPDIDIAGRISRGGFEFYPYIQLNDFRKRIGSKAVDPHSKLVDKAVTKVFVTAKGINNPSVDLIYCRIRSETGDIKATIGSLDTSTILDVDTPLEFINTQNEVKVLHGDTISIEYDKGTATSYIMISVNIGGQGSQEGLWTMLAEARTTNLNLFTTLWRYDLAGLMYTGGKVDLTARPMRGMKIKAGSSLIGKAITDIRLYLMAVGLFSLGSILRVKVIRGSDKVTAAVIGQLDATSISNEFFVPYEFQNLNNVYRLVAGDMIAVEFNYGDSVNFHILMRTTAGDLFEGGSTTMFEYNGRIYSDMNDVDLAGELWTGGFTVYPDPQVPPPIPPFHYDHGWILAAGMPVDSNAESDPSLLTPKEFSHCNIVLKEFRLYAIMLSQTQLENYHENRFTITPIPYGKVEIVAHDIVPYGDF